MKNTDLVCELFKLLRSQWRTRAEIERDIGISEPTVTKWTAEFTANGMLIDRQRSSHAGRGPAPAEFCLAPEWGGKAA